MSRLAARDNRLLQALVNSERQQETSLKSWTSDSATAAAALNAWAVADSTTPDFQDMAMRLSALLMSCADSQKHYTVALTGYREALAHILTRDKDLKTILRDRDILVSRVVKLTAKKPSERASDSYNIKLDEAQRELGACEAVLKQEEIELALDKQRIFKETLESRFKAMIDVAGLWQHTGEEALALLELVEADGAMPEGVDLHIPNGHINGHLTPDLASDDRRTASDPGRAASPVLQNHNRVSSSLGRAGGQQAVNRPPTVQEQDEDAGSTDEDEAAVRAFAAASRAPPARKQATSHVRNDSEDTTTGLPRKGGFFGSIANLFRPRDDIYLREADSSPKKDRFNSPKKGWSTRIDSNLVVTKALNEQSRQEQNDRRQSLARSTARRRESFGSEVERPRNLVRVVNSQGPPLWQELGIAPVNATAAKSRKRTASVAGDTPSLPAGNLYTHARKAMSDSGADVQSYEPPRTVKRKAGTSAPPQVKPSLSRTNSLASNTSTVRKSAMKQGTQVFQPVPATPSLLSVVSNNAARPVGSPPASPTSRKYLTGSNAPGGSLGSLGVVPQNSLKVKKKPIVPSHLPTVPRPPSVLSVPSSVAFSTPKEDPLDTLTLPSAAQSRALASGNTMVLPSAPLPVSSMLQVPSAYVPPPNHSQRSPSPIPFPTRPASVDGNARVAAHKIPNPAASSRSPSPTLASTTRRKSVRIADDNDVATPVEITSKGKDRATEDQISGWTTRQVADESEDEDADADYNAARTAMARRWDRPSDA